MRLVLVVVDDLMFSSRIQQTVKAHGGSIIFIRSEADLEKAPKSDLIILDLEHRRLSVLDLLPLVHPTNSSTPVIAYCSHVYTELAERAQSVGVKQVFTKGGFIQQLQSILEQS
ncbi:MAG: response regulator [Bacteroidetes bacterium]|nr:response regulator [Bacteroidota bacterium]